MIVLLRSAFGIGMIQPRHRAVQEFAGLSEHPREVESVTPATSTKSLQRSVAKQKLVDTQKLVSATQHAPETVVGGKLPADLRREQIIKVLLSLIADRAPGEISTQLIADRAGVSQATVFKHFATKGDLWVATAQWLGGELDKIWFRSRVDIHPEKALFVLEEIFQRLVEFFIRYPAVVRIMMLDCLRQEFSGVLKISRTLHQRYEQQVLSLLALAVQSRTVKGKLNCTAAAALFFCCIRGLGFQIATSSRKTNFRKEAQQVLKLYFSAIGGSPIRFQAKRGP